MSITPRSQIRLNAVTGSLAAISDIANQSLAANSRLEPGAAETIGATNLEGILGQLAASIKRIQGDDSKDFTEVQAGVFKHEESKFIGILSASSDARVGGSLTVRTASALSGAVEMKSTLDVDGLATLAQAKVEDLNVAGGIVFTDVSGRLDNDAKVAWDGSQLAVDGAISGSGNIVAAGNITGSNMLLSGDLALNGGDITSTSATFNIAGSSTAVNIGAAAGDVNIAGDLRINGNDIKASDGLTTISLSGRDVVIAGDLELDGNEIKSSTGAVAIQLTGSNVTVSGNGVVSGTMQVVGNLTGSTAQFSGQVRASSAMIDSLTQPGVVIAGANGLLTTTASLFYSENRLEVSSSVRISGDLAVNGEGGVADITSTASTAAIFDAGVNTIYMGNDAELIQMGEIGGLVEFAGDVRLTGSIEMAGTSAEYISKIDGGSLQLRAGDLSSGAGKVKVTLSGSDLRFDDGYRSGWDNDIKLAGSQNDWDRFKNIFGEASILQAISNAAALPTDAKFMYKVPSEVTAPAVITGDFMRQVDGTHFSGSFAAVPSGSRNENVDVFLNGQLLVSKSYDAVNYDYDIASNGSSITFNFDLQPDDFISVLVPVTVASVADYVQASGAGGGGGGGGSGGGGGEYIPATFFVEGAIPLFNGVNRSYVYKNCTVTAIALNVQTAATGASINIRINKNGAELTTASLAAGDLYEKISGLNLSLVEGDYLTLDVTQVGSTYPGYDLLVKVIAQ